jgi:hypothetical protein
LSAAFSLEVQTRGEENMSIEEATKKGLALMLVAAFAVGAIWLGGASADAEGKPSYGCSAGFDFHLTTTHAAELPRSQKAIDDGLVTKDDLIATYRARFDQNGNDMVCVQETPGWFKNAQNPLVEYLYNFVDDASSSPNGP